MKPKRQEHEPPLATSEWGWRYHHIDIPTTGLIADECYLSPFSMYVGGFGTSPYGIEWMQFEPESQVHELIQRVRHITFQVENMDAELSRRDFNSSTKPNSSAEGTRVAMTEHNGAPVELIEFRTVE